MAYIFKRKDTGVYWIIDKSIKGKSWIRLGKIKKAQALLELARYEKSLDDLRFNRPISPLDITLSELVEEYIDQVKMSKKPYTIEREASRLDRFCRETSPASGLFGKRKFYKITEDEIIHFCNSKNYKPNTIRLLLCALDQVFKYALSRRYTDSNPIEKIKKPKIEKSLPKYVDYEIIQEFIKHLNGNAKLYYILLAYTGMRPSEARLLKVEDVENDFIIIPKSKPGKFYTVAIHDELRPILKKLKRNKKSKDYLFTNNGKPYNRHAFYNSMKRAIKRIEKIKRPTPEQTAILSKSLSPHKMRHSYGTALVNSGVNLAAIQESMGHSSISTTMIYARIRPERLKEAVKVLPKIVNE